MGKTKELANDLRYVVSVPREVYSDIKDKPNVKFLSVRDYDMYQHFKNNAEWQEAEYEYKLAREKKSNLEDKIELNLINKK